MDIKETKAYQNLKKILSRDDVVCPFCHNDKFLVVQGYLTHVIQNSDQEYVLDKVNMLPCISIACTKCGFVSQHAVPILNSENE